MSMVSRAIVAGGGIGGIPAAIALCKAGFEVKVCRHGVAKAKDVPAVLRIFWSPSFVGLLLVESLTDGLPVTLASYPCLLTPVLSLVVLNKCWG